MASTTHVQFAQQTSPLASADESSAQNENVRPPLGDGRKNSEGHVLASPITDWKPDFKRTQSYQRDDLKRTVYGKEMGVGDENAVKEGGFTEGGSDGVAR